ncbi:MAG: hypothetical protein BHW26_03530 [Faecalibacterium prausnitzii]|nr:MAG: hypothetical protein BHW26_03530 [Faecalibacterium prausnitzii]
MMVHDFIFTDPFQGWHGVFLQSKIFKLRTKRTALLWQAVQTYIHLLILRCKMLVGECPKPL